MWRVGLRNRSVLFGRMGIIAFQQLADRPKQLCPSSAHPYIKGIERNLLSQMTNCFFPASVERVPENSDNLRQLADD